MKKLFSVLRMCETSLLQPGWVELERCIYPDESSQYHRLNGYSVIVEPGKEGIFREWVDNHLSASATGSQSIDYVDAVIPILSVLIGQEFDVISEAMLAYYSDFDAMMHYCEYRPEAEKLDVFGGEVVPILDEDAELEESIKQPEPIRQPEPIVVPEPIRQPELIVVPEPIRQPELIVVPEPIRQPELEQIKEHEGASEQIKQPESVVQPEVVPELFTEQQIQRITAYLATVDSSRIGNALLGSLRKAYRGENRNGITVLLLQLFDLLSVEERGDSI